METQRKINKRKIDMNKLRNLLSKAGNFLISQFPDYPGFKLHLFMFISFIHLISRLNYNRKGDASYYS